MNDTVRSRLCFAVVWKQGITVKPGGSMDFCGRYSCLCFPGSGITDMSGGTSFPSDREALTGYFQGVIKVKSKGALKVTTAREGKKRTF